MTARLKVCTVPGCPTLTRSSRCPEHAREQDRARGTKAERGYTTEHVRLRAELAPIVAAGRAVCHRCREPIAPDADWHLDHTDDRTSWLGPSHAFCNLSAAGRAAHGLPPKEMP